MRVRNRRKKVTCFTKDNIMKMTDGLFHKVFDEMGAEYPDDRETSIGSWISARRRWRTRRRAFDVIVMPNLYGDILSDVAAQIAGSVGLAGSANVGEQCAMFEAIHGSAPRRAGQNLANPSGLLLGAVMMLVHIDQPEIAERVHNAWLRTIEEGIHTYDIFQEGVSKQKVGTKEFAQAVVERVGQKPEKLTAVSYGAAPKQAARAMVRQEPRKELLGVDVFVDWKGTANELGRRVEKVNGGGMKLLAIANRGVRVYPDGMAETFCTDHWRCRFLGDNGAASHEQIVSLLGRFAGEGLDFIKTEHLCAFDGKRAYSQEGE